MADITITAVHPTDGRTIKFELDDDTTGKELIDNLIEEEFIPADSQGYLLTLKSEESNESTEINADDTLALAGVQNNDTLRIAPATDAGYKNGRV